MTARLFNSENTDSLLILAIPVMMPRFKQAFVLTRLYNFYK